MEIETIVIKNYKLKKRNDDSATDECILNLALKLQLFCKEVVFAEMLQN